MAEQLTHDRHGRVEGKAEHDGHGGRQAGGPGAEALRGYLTDEGPAELSDFAELAFSVEKRNQLGVLLQGDDSRALFPSAHRQATKMRKSCSGFVWPTWPSTPTSSSAREQRIDAAKTTSRRPNRSVANMRPVAVTRERMAVGMSRR